MKKKRQVVRLLVIVSLALVSIVALGLVILEGLWESSPLRVDSEVPVGPLVFNPVAAEVEFAVRGVEAKVPQIRLGIPPATEFVLQCRIHGVARSVAGERPVLIAVESSYICVQRGRLGAPSIAEVRLSPVMYTISDDDYSGGPIDIETTIEEIVNTMSWGENRYIVHCGTETSVVRVSHEKGGSKVLLPTIED